MRYDHQKIEKKWQRFWEKQSFWKARDFSKKPKFYLLVEFPYPSGEGLHVGHCRSYTALDIIARKKRMEGFNVLFPMGWDAFGLPTENYAVRTGIHPMIATRKNTANFKKQQEKLGLSFDWTREIATTDPNYYKWTQWIFLKLFNNGLAYKAKMPINWCPSCKIGLANEEVVDGKCERCGAEVTKREKEQWMLKITKYAERLIKDLNKIDYPEKVKILQRDWIGRSEGTEIKFPILNSYLSIKVFTTRVDTIFGATYLVLAPEHSVIEKLKSQISNFKSVDAYIKKAKRKLERERIAETKKKTGIILEGVKAVNPANGEPIPIFVADYVLPHYGTGAVMAVPCHDKRDFDFAKKYDLPLREVIIPDLKTSSGNCKECYEGEGFLINSGEFNGISSSLAREKILKWLGSKGLARKSVQYKLRDWVFSRQRYWGEPIPLVFCENCKEQIQSKKLKLKHKFSKGELLNPGWIAVPEKNLPIKLPTVKDFKPTEEGKSPLAKVKNWVKTTCPKCGSEAERETDVMPNWAGSNWYFLRYCDPDNNKKMADFKKLRYWMPVDWYNGGMEHATLHLLYSRFIYKFLWDIGEVPKSLGSEPYKKRTSHGMVLGEGGVKMSKSRGNVVNPDEVIEEYGADTMRLYEMFMGPFDQAIAWDSKGVKGVRRFLEKVWELSEIQNYNSKVKSERLKRLLHKTIKKVSEDIESMKFNTAVSSLMVLVNEMEKEKEIAKSDFEKFLILLSPFAPHIAEELWRRLGHKKSIFLEKWPSWSEKLVEEEEILLIIQVNGKVRDKIKVKKGISQEEAEKIALRQAKIKKWVEGKRTKKTVFIKDKLINFVI